MANIEYVEEIDDLIPVNHVFATATDKSGLVGNTRKDDSVIEGLPKNGLIGLLFEVNPKAVVISTGGTAKLMRNAGYTVSEIGDFTGWPEMPTGLVKSMHPKLYAGMLAHTRTENDAAYMKKNSVPSIDMALVNFYPFEQAVKDNPLGANPLAFEIIRQNMDVGGPTAVHTSRKGFLGTAVTTRPEDYVEFAQDLREHEGKISLEARFEAMKHVSEDLAKYHESINRSMQAATLADVKAAYKVIHNPSGGD